MQIGNVNFFPQKEEARAANNYFSGKEAKKREGRNGKEGKKGEECSLSAIKCRRQIDESDSDLRQKKNFFNIREDNIENLFEMRLLKGCFQYLGNFQYLKILLTPNRSMKYHRLGPNIKFLLPYVYFQSSRTFDKK